ncbi:MAG: oxidoreductase [Chitinophagaceae bacterium]|nr:oxidoreductase [Chitinophagaceae bacterium]
MKSLFFILLIVCFKTGYNQRIQLLQSGNKVSLRGLSVVTDKIIWVSGNKGTVGRSVDSGKTWKWIAVKGFEKRDFRDIEAFDAVTAVIMAIEEPAQLLKTVDGGETWKIVYTNTTKGMFLDAMEFWNEESGIVIGDPVDGRFFIGRTFDGGSTWGDIPKDRLPLANAGEACFAASGTNVRSLTLAEACFVTGGSCSRLLWKGKPVELPFPQGKASTGANSIAIRDSKKRNGSSYFVVVGGDYTQDTLSEKNCFITKDAGKTWVVPPQPPHGYRSCVEFITMKELLACGTSGVDFSTDGGMHWSLISNTGFHVCRKAKNGKSVWLAGADGRIGILNASH